MILKARISELITEWLGNLNHKLNTEHRLTIYDFRSISVEREQQIKSLLNKQKLLKSKISEICLPRDSM